MPLEAKNIKNKAKRLQVVQRRRDAKNKERHKLRAERAAQEAKDPQLRQERLKENVTHTLESKRVYDETMQAGMEGDDEFEAFFTRGTLPKVFITTNINPHPNANEFASYLSDIFPNSTFIQRKEQFDINTIAQLSAKRDYTDLIVVNEDHSIVNGLSIIHLPQGPSFYFNVSSLVTPKQIRNHGNSTSHFPELVLNNFTTRLGLQLGRLFQALFPQKPEFVGRQVVTLHNQRDFIFFRRHRYQFKSEERVGLQELGPQFTLKLRRIQRGIRKEVEWQHHPSMDKDRRKFNL